MVRVTYFIAVLGACLLFATATFGQTCPNIDLQVIQQPPLILAYNSWVDPPRNGGRMYTFGRCVGTLTAEQLTIDWQGTQLGGSSQDHLPLIGTFSFVDGTAYQSASTLKFYSDPKQQYQKGVNFLANGQEIGRPSAPPIVVGEVQDLQKRVRDGEKIDETALNATSTARIPIVTPGMPPSIFSVSFVSFLSAQAPYRYLISYTLDWLSAPGAALVPQNLAMRSRTATLAAAIRAKFDSERIPIRENKGAFALQSAADGQLSMAVGQLELFDGDRTIGAFPVGFYVPLQAR